MEQLFLQLHQQVFWCISLLYTSGYCTLLGQIPLTQSDWMETSINVDNLATDPQVDSALGFDIERQEQLFALSHSSVAPASCWKMNLRLSLKSLADWNRFAIFGSIHLTLNLDQGDVKCGVFTTHSIFHQGKRSESPFFHILMIDVSHMTSGKLQSGFLSFSCGFLLTTLLLRPD